MSKAFSVVSALIVPPFQPSCTLIGLMNDTLPLGLQRLHYFPSNIALFEDFPVITALFFSFFVLCYTLSGSKNAALPPGPLRLPLIGNALQLPRVNPWLTFTEWAKVYGKIFYVEAFGKQMLIINTVEAARELLDKRSLISSNRPHLMMASELIGFNESFVMQQHNDDWRQKRKLVSQAFTVTAVPKYHTIQEKQARLLVQNLVKDPSTFIPELQLRIGLLIFRVTYGYYPESREDRFFQLSIASMENYIYSATPGNFLVDIFPSLKHVPSWLPGAGFKKYAAECREKFQEATWTPFLWSKKALDTGEVLLPNVCSTIISEAGGALSEAAEQRLAMAAVSVLGGGLDTNIATALVFFLLMLRYPDAQGKAHAEIDAVVGSNRLPTISDRASLPYVRSLLTEVLRLHPVSVLGLPHTLSESAAYEGYHLPKDCILIPNVWNMMHDPEVYERPMDFIPERYNNSDAEMKKVTDVVFGFGRRVCPGSCFAEGTLYAIILTVLATCEILPPLDANGKPVIQDVPFISGLIVFPAPFEIRLKYRLQSAKDLLAETSPHAE